MIRLLIFALVIAGILGVIGYEDDKVIIDTEKGKKFIDENVELK